MPFSLYHIGKFTEYQELSSKIQHRDVCYLEQYLKAHVGGESPMASLKSRCGAEEQIAPGSRYTS